jgi:hypothetical protein
MADVQRALEIEPVRVREHARGDRVAVAARRVPAESARRVLVVGAQSLCDGRLTDPAALVGAVEQVTPVEQVESGGYLAAGGARLPTGEMVEPGQRLADVLVSDEPVLGSGAVGVLGGGVGIRGGGGGGLAAECGKAASGIVVRTAESGVEKLLHLRSRPTLRFVVPLGDGTHADPELGGEPLIAQPQRGLEHAGTFPGPAGHRFQIRMPPANAMCTRHAPVAH